MVEWWVDAVMCGSVAVPQQALVSGLRFAVGKEGFGSLKVTVSACPRPQLSSPSTLLSRCLRLGVASAHAAGNDGKQVEVTAPTKLGFFQGQVKVAERTHLMVVGLFIHHVSINLPLFF